MFNQEPFPIKFDWGGIGASRASQRGDIIVIVDVLSFSTSVVAALASGAIIFPFPYDENLTGYEYAKEIKGELILGRAEALKSKKPSLSPASFNNSHSGKKYVLSSKNGALCTWLATDTEHLFIGCFNNATAVANVVNDIRKKTNKNVTIIACGEKWENNGLGTSDSLRPCIEDFLAAGSILSKLEGKKSPEAEVSSITFLNSQHKILSLIENSGSGQELVQRGFKEDVVIASNINSDNVVPIICDKCVTNYIV